MTNMCDKISQFFNVLFIHVFIQVSCLRGKYLNNLFLGYISKIVYFVKCVTVRFAWILSHSILYNFIQKIQKNSFQNVRFPNRQKACHNCHNCVTKLVLQISDCTKEIIQNCTALPFYTRKLDSIFHPFFYIIYILLFILVSFCL